MRWAGNNGVLADQLRLTFEDYNLNEIRIFEAVGRLRQSATVLQLARAPIHDVQNATDILSVGAYLRFPRIVQQEGASWRLEDRLPEMDEAETMRKLEQCILERLLRTAKVPPQFTSLRISNGTLECSVYGEFSVLLSLSGSAPDSPWLVLKVSIFVRGDSTSYESVKGGGQKRQKMSVSASIYPDDDVEDDESDIEENCKTAEASLTNVEQESGKACDKDTEMQDALKRETLSGATNQPSKKRKRVGKVRNASSAFQPKREAVLYLLKLLQERLNSSPAPLVDTYRILHTFCVQLSLRTLAAQATELTEHHWKAGALRVSPLDPAQSTLELKHWGKTCTLRIRFEPERRDGQLYVELDPPVDTAYCRSSIALALTRAPPARRRRQLFLSDEANDDPADVAAVMAESERVVDGLTLNRLNVEKVLMLGALAHSEARLNSIGSELDRLLLETETLFGNSSSAAASFLSLVGSPSWAAFFKHTVSIVTDQDQVALHIDLPVQRYLRVSVEMRTGKLLITLVRRIQAATAANAVEDTIAAAECPSQETQQQSRRWGSTTDQELLSQGEALVNQCILSTATNKMAMAARELLKVVFAASMHSIMESIEMAADERQLPSQRACPLFVAPMAAPIQSEKAGDRGSAKEDSSTPCLFIRLNSWDGKEYFLGVCGKGLSASLFNGLEATPRHTSTVNASAVKGSTTAANGENKLEWFVVGGPIKRHVCVDRSSVVLSQPLTGIAENFSSDVTVREMVLSALDRAQQECLLIRVADFKRHFSQAAVIEQEGSTITLQVTDKMCGLVAHAFGAPKLRLTFFKDLLGFDMTFARSADDPTTSTSMASPVPKTDKPIWSRPANLCKNLPAGGGGALAQEDLGLVFALTGKAVYLANTNTDKSFANCGGLCMQYRPDNEQDQNVLEKRQTAMMSVPQKSLPSSSSTTQTQTPPPMSSNAPNLSPAPASLSQKSARQAVSEDASPIPLFSDLGWLSTDLIAAAKMEIFAQCLLSLASDETKPLVIVFGKGDATARVVSASHVAVVLECSYAGVTLVAAVGIAAGEPNQPFDVRVLSVRHSAIRSLNKLPLPERLPWADEIRKVLNQFISSKNNYTDWRMMCEVSQQVASAFTVGLPLLPVLHDMLNPRPGCILSANKELEKTGATPGGTPAPATPDPGGRPGGKFALSKSIRAQKEAADRGSRGVSVRALSHLRLRIYVGEQKEFDIFIVEGGIRIEAADQKIVAPLIPTPVLDYQIFPSVFRKVIFALLDEADKVAK